MSAAILVCLAFALAWATTAIIERKSARLGLVQSPNSRSAHIQPTPTGGGASIAIVGILGFIFIAVQGNPKYAGAAAIGAAFAALGLIDDRFNLSPALRFPLQAILIGATVSLAGPLPAIALGSLQIVGLPLTAISVLAGLWWINLFNFMDGIDGIAGTQAILILAGASLILPSDQSPQLASGIIMAATAGFLTRNWPPARIFMGDVGSNFLAFAIFVLALFESGNSDTSYPIILILISVFMADATVTLLRRVFRGEKPWKAHNTHAYQQLARRFGHRKITLMYGAISLVWSAPIASLAGINPSISWGLVAIAYAPLLIVFLIAGGGQAHGQIK
ncbi:Fuc2NAc and GlcNAc transferase [Devosia sp. UYZn731]|uniref:MraY family glycosyltransferase n=1 Tax=Devosia sp. UYZn731 TaxID=3156345 RepID=UPI0033943136